MVIFSCWGYDDMHIRSLIYFSSVHEVNASARRLAYTHTGTRIFLYTGEAKYSSLFHQLTFCLNIFAGHSYFLFLPFERYQLCMHHECYYDLYLFCSTWFHANITILSCVNLCKSCSSSISFVLVHFSRVLLDCISVW